MQNEVIIDGCNVAECEHYGGDYCYMTNCLNNCEDEPNCYFKQLQRAKAENEKLKSRNKLYKKIIKENIEKANNNFMILTACIQGNLSIDEVKEYAKLNAKIKPYKQALKEVAKYCNECNLKADYTACEILRIINEVLKYE